MGRKRRKYGPETGSSRSSGAPLGLPPARKASLNTQKVAKIPASAGGQGQVKHQKRSSINLDIELLFRLLLVLISAAIYLNSLNNGFVYDDRPAILNNIDVVSADRFTSNWLARLIRNDFWGTPISQPGSHKSYRPLVSLSFALQSDTVAAEQNSNQQRTEIGPPSAFNLHLFNLIIHICVVDLVFQLAKQSDTLCKPSDSQNQSSVAMLTSLLFACHPVHVEAVSSLVGRAELMGAMFALLSFRYLMRYLNQCGCMNLIVSSTFAAAACLSKENCATILLINLMLIAWCSLQTNPKRPRRRQASLTNLKPEFALASVAMLSLLGAYLTLRMQLTFHQAGDRSTTGSTLQMSAVVPKFSYSDNPLAQDVRQFCIRHQASNSRATNTELSGRERQSLCNSQEYLDRTNLRMLATRFLLLPWANFKLLIYPKTLSYDWSLESLGGLVESANDPRCVPALVFYSALSWLTLGWLLRWAQGYLQPRQELKWGQTDAIEELNEEEYYSDSSSVQSIETTKSGDSGFVDSNDAEQPSRFAASKQASQVKLDAQKSAYFWPLVWLLVPYLPASNLVIPVGFLVAERTLYLPSVGFCLLVANLIEQHHKKLLIWTRRALMGGNKGEKGGLMVRLVRKSRTSKPLDVELATKLALIFPLLILGSLKIVQRNYDWRDEISLFRSNMRQSSSKSLANLATVLSEGRQLDRSPAGGLSELYRAALELEPTSADHHYNLALALQQQGGSADEIVQHYRTALKLRPNFALAALNLGSYQYTNLGRLGEAIESFHECGFSMNATRSRSYHHQARVAIECLISGAKLHLDRRNSNSASEGRDYEQQQLGLQTNGLPVKQTTSVGNGCRLALEWIQLAKLKATELEPGAGFALGAGSGGGGELQRIGDLDKQMATIHWLSAQCVDSGGEKREQLEQSILHAFRSQVSVPWPIYSQLAALLSELAGDREALHLLERAVKVEQVKKPLDGRNLAGIHYAKARRLSLKAGGNLRPVTLALAELEQALQLNPDSTDYLTEAARLAYESRALERSEQLYMQALKKLAGDLEPDKIRCQPLSEPKPASELERARRKLGSAHANYGAILQVNGRLEKALQQYRHALDCDPNNLAALSNIKQLV